MNNEIIFFIINLVVSAAVSGLVVSFRLGKYQEKVDSLEKKTDRLEESVSTTTHKLTEVSTKLDERTEKYSEKTLTKSESPVVLSDSGQDLLKRSGADKFVLDNKDELITKIKEKNPHSAYDVQVYAKRVVEELQDEERFKPIKDFVYQEGIKLEPIFIVAGLYLRDLALTTLGYTQDQLDESDPSQTNNEKVQS